METVQQLQFQLPSLWWAVTILGDRLAAVLDDLHIENSFPLLYQNLSCTVDSGEKLAEYLAPIDFLFALPCTCYNFLFGPRDARNMSALGFSLIESSCFTSPFSFVDFVHIWSTGEDEYINVFYHYATRATK